MARNIFSARSLRFINIVFGILITVVVISIFFSEKIAQHRIQALLFFGGIGLVLWGIDITIKEDFVYPITISKKKRIIKKPAKVPR